MVIRVIVKIIRKKEVCKVSKKTLIGVLALAVAMSGSGIIPGAQEPLYDEQGNLILDLPQEPYRDLSTPQYQPTDSEEVNGTPPVSNTPAPTENSEVINPITQTQVPVINSASQTTQTPVANTNTVQQELGTLSPASGTYMYQSNTVLVTTGNKVVKSVSVENASWIPATAWTIQNNAVTFKPSELDDIDDGMYNFIITFADNTTANYSLKVIGKPITEYYWQQNIKGFSKDPRASTHKDLELTSNNPFLKVQLVTMNKVEVPASKYRIVNGTVIISKDWLATQPTDERARVTVKYDDDKVMDFSLEIHEMMESNNTAEDVDC